MCPTEKEKERREGGGHHQQIDTVIGKHPRSDGRTDGPVDRFPLTVFSYDDDRYYVKNYGITFISGIAK